ncbi:MAG: hypothetical protein SOV37_01070 [Candidatus Borkfalkiaceae bacterium]|nr:hypothetical protein [Christensenellaceae bacterium]MDY3724397.1 hypothetical protein [Christensenellaceae bacterium]
MNRVKTTAAIPWNKVQSIYRVLFQGDRHAIARDDRKFQPRDGEGKEGYLTATVGRETESKK